MKIMKIFALFLESCAKFKLYFNLVTNVRIKIPIKMYRRKVHPIRTIIEFFISRE